MDAALRQFFVRREMQWHRRAQVRAAAFAVAAEGLGHVHGTVTRRKVGRERAELRQFAVGRALCGKGEARARCLTKAIQQMPEILGIASVSPRLALLFAMFAVTSLPLVGCAGGELTRADTARPSGALYRPGQSLDARLCECRECFKAACCNGEAESDDVSEASSETELGISVSACGRCVRRTWTVRGSTSCESRAPSECCSGSVSI
jgi:hypothetical protein